jgi:hypothetical protein
VDRWAGRGGLLRALEQSSNGLDFIRALLRYLAQVASTDRLSATELRQAVTQALSGGGEQMMTIAEQWVQEGMEKGMEKGIGQDQAKLLKLQIQQRFGPLPMEVETRLRDAPPEQLEAWALRVLEAASLDEVFGPGGGH